MRGRKTCEAQAAKQARLSKQWNMETSSDRGKGVAKAASCPGARRPSTTPTGVRRVPGPGLVLLWFSGRHLPPFPARQDTTLPQSPIHLSPHALSKPESPPLNFSLEPSCCKPCPVRHALPPFFTLFWNSAVFRLFPGAAGHASAPCQGCCFRPALGETGLFAPAYFAEAQRSLCLARFIPSFFWPCALVQFPPRVPCTVAPHSRVIAFL